MTEIPADIIAVAEAIENKYTNYDGPSVEEIAEAIWNERMASKHRVTIMATVEDDQIVVTLAGATDLIAISFKLTVPEARKLIEAIKAQKVRLEEG